MTDRATVATEAAARWATDVPTKLLYTAQMHIAELRVTKDTDESPRSSSLRANGLAEPYDDNVFSLARNGYKEKWLRCLFLACDAINRSPYI